jgi:hypothetical protein
VPTNRRDALKGGIAFVGAAAGLAAASTAANAADNKSLVVYGRGWRISSQDIGRGELPAAGVRMLSRGEIVDKPRRGRKIGDFFATYYRLNPHGKVAAHEAGSLELHTFAFSDGTIVGSGISSAGSQSEGIFAITGGTGRFLGARGSYVARQNHADFGGDGTATFTFTLI